MIKKIATVTSSILLIAGLAACGSQKEGEQVVFDRINAMTDCAELQKQFDTATANGEAARNRGNYKLGRVSTEYMDAAWKRMEDLHCVNK